MLNSEIILIYNLHSYMLLHTCKYGKWVGLFICVLRGLVFSRERDSSHYNR